MNSAREVAPQISIVAACLGLGVAPRATFYRAQRPVSGRPASRQASPRALSEKRADYFVRDHRFQRTNSHPLTPFKAAFGAGGEEGADFKAAFGAGGEKGGDFKAAFGAGGEEGGDFKAAFGAGGEEGGDVNF